MGAYKASLLYTSHLCGVLASGLASRRVTRACSLGWAMRRRQNCRRGLRASVAGATVDGKQQDNAR